jgi:hypothetical protein
MAAPDTLPAAMPGMQPEAHELTTSVSYEGSEKAGGETLSPLSPVSRPSQTGGPAGITYTSFSHRRQSSTEDNKLAQTKLSPSTKRGISDQDPISKNRSTFGRLTDACGVHMLAIAGLGRNSACGLKMHIDDDDNLVWQHCKRPYIPTWAIKSVYAALHLQ